jgi:hypothetical protein
MRFWDLFLLFSLYTIGFYHFVVGLVGVITGSALVYPMPYTLNRPSLYLMVVWVVFVNQFENALGPLANQILGFLLLLDLGYETARPLITPVITVIGTSSESINGAMREALSQLSISFKGEGPNYLILDPFAKISLRFRQRLGTAEVRISPYKQKALLEKIALLLAKKLDSQDGAAVAPRGYLEFIIVGIVLMVCTFLRLSLLLVEG